MSNSKIESKFQVGDTVTFNHMSTKYKVSKVVFDHFGGIMLELEGMDGQFAQSIFKEYKQYE